MLYERYDSIGDNAFYDCVSLTSASVSAYKAATSWSYFKSIIVAN
jgi:hypothetical protein